MPSAGGVPAVLFYSMPDSLEELTSKLREFSARRDWEQFHSPKNLAMALIVEAAELVEQFQWLSQEDSLNLSAEQKNAVRDELADVLIYLVRLADRLDVDLLAAAADKMARNARRYPEDLARSRADKYTAYQEKP